MTTDATTGQTGLRSGDYSERHVQVAGTDVRVLYAGAGPALVVLHHDIGPFGWPEFYNQLAKSFTVYAPDLPGYGLSERPEWARNVRDIVVLTGLIMDGLALTSATVVGLGFGGWIAAELASNGVQRFEKLVLVCPAGIQPREGEIFDQFLVGHEDYVKRGVHDVATFNRLFGELASIEQLIEWDVAREMTTRVGWKPYMFNQALPHVLKSVVTPTLVVWGDDDRVVPRVCGDQYIEALPNARLEIVANCGHWVDLEQPEQLAKLVADFGAH